VAEKQSFDREQIPEEIRDDCAELYDDVVMLHLKWRFYSELFPDPEHARLLSNSAGSFFHVVEEALRADVLMTICRLSDPTPSLARVNLSFAILRGKCTDLPKVDNLITAFQAACGNLRRYRNRYIAHNDLESNIPYHEMLLPGVGRFHIGEILQLAREILRTVYRHYAKLELDFEPAHSGGAKDLVDWIKRAQHSVVEE
jgi:hypothetical protein